MEDVIPHAFGISPDTVFRVLTGFLTLAVIALWRALLIERKSRNKLSDKLLVIAQDNVGAMKDINGVLQSIKEVHTVRDNNLDQRLAELDKKLDTWFSRIEREIKG